MHSWWSEFNPQHPNKKLRRLVPTWNPGADKGEASESLGLTSQTASLIGKFQVRLLHGRFFPACAAVGCSFHLSTDFPYSRDSSSLPTETAIVLEGVCKGPTQAGGPALRPCPTQLPLLPPALT